MLKRLTEKIAISAAIVISGTAVSYFYLGSWVYASLIGVVSLLSVMLLLSSQKEKDDRLQMARSKIDAAGYETTLKFAKNVESEKRPTDLNNQEVTNSTQRIPPELEAAFTLLQIDHSKDTSLSSIKRAFHKRVRAYHPDLDESISQDEATKNISKLKDAKRLCMDFIQRSENV